MKTPNRFKAVLANMEHKELLNFAWSYDQYAQSLPDGEFPVSFVVFYIKFYPQVL